MDLTGIEPVSESLSTRVSTIIAASLHSLNQPKNSILLVLVASYYTRKLKALSVSFPAIMTPITEYAGVFGSTSGIKPLLNRNSCRLNLFFWSVYDPDGCSCFKTPVETWTGPYMKTTFVVLFTICRKFLRKFFLNRHFEMPDWCRIKSDKRFQSATPCSPLKHRLQSCRQPFSDTFLLSFRLKILHSYH